MLRASSVRVTRRLARRLSTVECDAEDADAVQRCVAQFGEQPFVVRRFARDWTLVRARDPLERLRSALGGVNVPIEAGSDYLSADLIDVPGDLYVAALQQLAAAGDDGGAARATAYMAQVSVHALPEAARQLFAERVPTLAPAGIPPPYRTNVWLGPIGTVTPAHRDPYPNIVVQLLGAKVVRLYTPGDAGMYPFERGASLQTNTSRVDVEAAEIDPQFAAFAERRKDDERVVTLAPGDALHIPRHWWHHVRATSVSATVNFWWPAPRQLPDFEPGRAGIRASD